MAYLRFDIKTGGTGTVETSVWLSWDETLDSGSEGHVHGEFTLTPDGMLVRAVCAAYYFAADPETADEEVTARQSATAHADDLKASLRFRPPIVKELARGAVVLPNIHNNFGDLVAVDTEGGDHVVLANCTCSGVEIEDDPKIHGVRYLVSFTKAAEASAP